MNTFTTFNFKNPSPLSLGDSISTSPNSSIYRSFNTPPKIDIPSLNILNNSCSPVKPFQRFPNLAPLSPFNFCPPLQEPQLPMASELSNTLLMLKLQQTLQAEIFKKEMQKLLEIKNSLLEKLNQQNIQQELTENAHTDTSDHLTQTRTSPNRSVKVEDTLESPKVVRTALLPSQKTNLKSQIADIITFILENFGRINESGFDEEKEKFSYNPRLIEVFDIMVSKYSATIKTKEEMVKYTLRRAFKFIKNNLKKQTNTNTKGVSKTLCKKYFRASQDEILKVGSEEEFLKFVLPFRKRSKNKTMNTNFIKEIFSSEDFSRDYDSYLRSFDNILEADNKSKINKLISFIEDCVVNDKLQEMKNYKRIPWPKLWITNTKKIAQDLPHTRQNPEDSPSASSRKLKRSSTGDKSYDENQDDNRYVTEGSQNSPYF